LPAARGDSVVVTCKIPKELVEAIDKLVEEGVFSSRSEAIRYAVGELVSKGVAGARRWARPEKGRA